MRSVGLKQVQGNEDEAHKEAHDISGLKDILIL